MKPINSVITFPAPKKSTARTAKEDLIDQIVMATTERGKKASDLRRLLAVTTNTMKWNERDLAIILGKRNDPKVRNYTALVWWHAKIKGVDAAI